MPTHQPILLASSNAHKLAEVRAALAELDLEVEGLDAVSHDIDPPAEDQPDFEGNAVLKARYYAGRTGRLTLADDSGLEVDALDGRPGVHSARYAGVIGDRATVDAANNEKLLRELAGVPDDRRTARFVCVMALCDAEHTRLVVRGTVDGRILHAPRGEGGFGYDPLFYIPELGKAAAELTREQKNAVSHRGNAVRKLVAALRSGPSNR